MDGLTESRERRRRTLGANGASVSRVVLGGAAGLVLLIAGSVVLVGPAVGSDPGLVSMEQMIARFSDPKQPSDRLPHDIEHLEMGLDASSSRRLAAGDLGSYWIARNESGEICLAATFESHGGVSAASCTNQLDFHRNGLGLRVSIGSTDEHDSFSTSVLLVADGTDDSSVEGTKIVPGLFLLTEPRHG